MNKIKTILKKIIHKIATPKIATIMMIHLLGFSMFAAFNPTTDISNFSKNLNQLLALDNFSPIKTISFQNHFESFAVVFTLISLGISLLISIFYRSKTEIKRNKKSNIQKNDSAISNLHQTYAKKLEENGYGVSTNNSGVVTTIRGLKGKYGNIGSILFHSSLVIILLGIVVSKYASFDGTLALTEGQTFNSSKDRFLNVQSGKYYQHPKEDFTFKLLKVEPSYKVNGAAALASIIENVKKKNTDIPVYINNGYTVEGLTLHQGDKTGYSPFIHISDKNGKIITEGYTRLASYSQNGQRIHSDYLEFENGSLRFEFELLPDAAFRDGKYVSRTDELKSPVLRVVVLKDKNVLTDTYVPAGGIVNAEKYEIAFGDLRRWSEFTLSNDPGLSVILFGVAFGFIGLVLRLLSVRKEIIINLYSINESITFDIMGTTEKFHASFEDELSVMRTDLENVLKKFPKLVVTDEQILEEA
ncbi:MAG: cytochrome c biogenesis protein ResB [Bacteroidota bacterium]|nr:cytochrome c biogenesis protein ResB [Bacteroidota bacterium]